MTQRENRFNSISGIRVNQMTRMEKMQFILLKPIVLCQMHLGHCKPDFGMMQMSIIDMPQFVFFTHQKVKLKSESDGDECNWAVKMIKRPKLSTFNLVKIRFDTVWSTSLKLTSWDKAYLLFQINIAFA